MPDCGQPSSTVTSRFVFFTVAMMASRSSGRSDRRLMTSAETPWASRVAAASIAWRTPLPNVTIETSLPSRIVLALPNGSTKSLLRMSALTGKDMPYRISFSSTQTGPLSRTAALRSPRASSAS
eukprot:Amastigsp_a841314_229.p3 type:complete len:124 gc:universal Amastigsp_a841314_229:193-564(+)